MLYWCTIMSQFSGSMHLSHSFPTYHIWCVSLHAPCVLRVHVTQTGVMVLSYIPGTWGRGSAAIGIIEQLQLKWDHTKLEALSSQLIISLLQASTILAALGSPLRKPCGGNVSFFTCLQSRTQSMTLKFVDLSAVHGW